MPLRRRRRSDAPPPPPPGLPPQELVKLYLRGQNLEQMQRTDEAIVCYEEAVTARFDSAGPYDRLLFIYREREANEDIVRVAEAAQANVRTFEQKASWYKEMATNARERIKAAPDPKGPEF